MTRISIDQLSFAHEGAAEYIFKNLSLNLDSDWHLGFIGRNGQGKTTLLKLLAGAYQYSGRIISPLIFDYFPPIASPRKYRPEGAWKPFCWIFLTGGWIRNYRCSPLIQSC